MERAAKGAQGGVTGGMAVGVVALLQPVEIHHNDDQFLAGSIRIGEIPGDVLFQRSPVWHTGQGIDQGGLSQIRGHADHRRFEDVVDGRVNDVGDVAGCAGRDGRADFGVQDVAEEAEPVHALIERGARTDDRLDQRA